MHLVGIVRGPDGRPKFDDIDRVDAGVIMCLSQEEKEQLGLWLGPLAQDAQGRKRLTRRAPGEYTAVDPLVAVSEIFDTDGSYHRLGQRIDVPAGGTFKTGD